MKRIVETIGYEPREYEDWEFENGHPRWSEEVHEKLHYRLFEVRVLADLDEETGAYTVRAFQLGDKTFMERDRG